MIQQIRSGWELFRGNDLRTLLMMVHSKDAHPFVQFLKYGFCGVVSVVVHTAVFALMSHWIYPAVDQSLGDSTRAFRATMNNFVAFILSNFTAYYTNAKWVFVQGRHGPVKEFLIFTSVSLVSFTAGLLLVPVLIKGFGVHTWVAQGAFVVTSALINYACRKFFVFQR